MQGRIEKFGRSTSDLEDGAEQPDSHKVKVMRELDENLNDLKSEKIRVASDIQQIEAEMVQTI